MKLYFMLVRRVPPAPSPVLVEVFNHLSRRGFQVEGGIAEELLTRPDQLEVKHDLYLLKSHTEMSLSLAGILHQQGAWLLNPYPSCIATQDKIMASRRLRAAGIPTPASWVTGDLALLRPLIEERPLIIKPYRGHRGAGVRLAHNAAELAALPPLDDLMLIQEYIPGTGEDLKVYVIGQEVFAVRKEFSPTSFTRAGRPVPVSAEVRDIALRCGQAFGLGLYGLDIIESPTGPVVVDLNYFPGYKGVPNAASLIANYIEDYVSGQYLHTLPKLAQLRESDHQISQPVQMLPQLSRQYNHGRLVDAH
ncbi:MAG: ATP-grasp domain-containing protein [Anaerolineae bacterium]